MSENSQEQVLTVIADSYESVICGFSVSVSAFVLGSNSEPHITLVIQVSFLVPESPTMITISVTVLFLPKHTQMDVRIKFEICVG